MLNLPLALARQDWFCDPSSLLFDIIQGYFLGRGEGAKLLKRETNHLPPNSAEVNTGA
jgi:hypothetical protein